MNYCVHENKPIKKKESKMDKKLMTGFVCAWFMNVAKKKKQQPENSIEIYIEICLRKKLLWQFYTYI